MSLFATPEGTRYHVQVKQTGNFPWTKPSVGNIDNGFASEEDAAELINVLAKIDLAYYKQGKGAAMRIVETTTREVLVVDL